MDNIFTYFSFTNDEEGVTSRPLPDDVVSLVVERLRENKMLKIVKRLYF